MYFLLKIVILHCHVSFGGSKSKNQNLLPILGKFPYFSPPLEPNTPSATRGFTPKSHRKVLQMDLLSRLKKASGHRARPFEDLGR